MEDEIPLRQYMEVVWRQRSVIALVALVVVLAVGLFSLFVVEPVYEATAVLLLSGPRVQVTASSNIQIPIALALTVDTLIPMVHNEVVAEEVAKRLKSMGRIVDRADLVTRVRFAGIRGTNLVRVTVRDSSSAGATAIVEAWAETVVNYADSLALQETRQALSLIEQKINDTRAELVQAETSLRDFRASSRLPILDQRVSETLRRIASYEARLAEAQQSGLPAGGEVSLRPAGNSYVLTVTSVRNPNQIRGILKVLRSDLDTHQSALATERETETRLLRQADLARATHQLLVGKREELRILLGANSGMVKVAVPALPPETPITPRRLRNVVAGGVVGILLGIVAGFAAEYLGVAPGRRTAASTPILSKLTREEEA